MGSAVMGKCSWIAFASLASLQAEASAEDSQIVAVFDMQAKGVDLGQDAVVRLSDYVASLIAGTGGYRVVPRDQIHAQLAQKKAESYDVCFDEACQVEIGRELAAQKSLAVLLIKLGSGCAVSLTLYDLRTAATERASTTEGGCSEDQVVELLKMGIRELTQAGAPGAGVERTAPPAGEVASNVAPVEVGRDDAFVHVRPSGLEIALDLGYVTSFRGFTGGSGPSLSLAGGYRFPFSSVLLVRPEAVFRFMHLFTDPRSTDYGVLFGASVVAPLGAVEIVGGAHVGPLFSFSDFFFDVRGSLGLTLSRDYAMSAGVAYERYLSPPLGDARLADFLVLTIGLSRVWD